MGLRPSSFRSSAEHHQDLRSALVAAATRLLAQEGPNAVSTRRIAAEVGASTTAIYTLFGSKEGLIHALYLDGFEHLREALEAVPCTDDPLADLEALGWAYRRHALSEPERYAVMFGHLVAGFSPPAESVARTKRSFAVLLDAVRRCLEAGLLSADDPVEVADILWAGVHGMVSLELVGYHPDEELAQRRYAAMLYATVSAYLRPSGPP